MRIQVKFKHHDFIKINVTRMFYSHATLIGANSQVVQLLPPNSGVNSHYLKHNIATVKLVYWYYIIMDSLARDRSRIF